jgi:crotonobetainyl-CoA:carnitine CoA-transferase CaiB-like acyl-CoA transferase
MGALSRGGLAGLRVLDVTHFLAGPFCTQMLADHGADVIKIEPPDGDHFRTMGPWVDGDSALPYGGFFQCCNRNKRGIVIDFKVREGRELFLRLVEQADAVVENFRIGVMDKMGLGYEALAARNPRLVYTSVRGFGDAPGGLSPYAQWPAFDVVAQAMGGLMGITGPSPEQPTKVGGGLGDTVGGLFAAFGTMVALWQARASGRGQYVDVSMLDSVFALSELQTSLFSANGVVVKPNGNRMPGIAPAGTLRAKDGLIAIAAPHKHLWIELCRLVGRPELVDDPRFVDEAARWTNREALDAILEGFTATRTKRELMQVFGGHVPFGPVFDAADAFADPHFAARGMLPELEIPGAAHTVRVPGVPPKLSDTPGGVVRRAPLLGEHTFEVLREAGLGADEIERLRATVALGPASAPESARS